MAAYNLGPGASSASCRSGLEPRCGYGSEEAEEAEKAAEAAASLFAAQAATWVGARQEEHRAACEAVFRAWRAQASRAACCSGPWGTSEGPPPLTPTPTPGG